MAFFSRAVEPHRETTRELASVFGTLPITDLTLNFPVDGVATANLEIFLTEEQVKQIGEILARVQVSGNG